MHTHFPRLLYLVRPIVFFLQFVSIHLHFYARLVGRDFYYCHEYIKNTINHKVIRSESATHLSCSLGAFLLITHTGQDRDMNLRRRRPDLPSSRPIRISHGYNIFLETCYLTFSFFFFFLSWCFLVFHSLHWRYEMNLTLFQDQSIVFTR